MARLLYMCLLGGVLLAPVRAQTQDEGLPPPHPRLQEAPLTQDSTDLDLARGRALARAVGEERVLAVACFDVTAADVAVLTAQDPLAAVAAQNQDAVARRVGSGVKVEMGGLTVIHHAFQSEADAVAHAGAFLHHGLLGAAGLPRLELLPGERPAQLIELAGKSTLLAWGPALEDPARAARILAAAREAFGVSAPADARALFLSDHVQVALLRPELPSLVSLREALEAARPGERSGELVERRDDLRVRLAVHPGAGRLELTRADRERAQALRELALPLPSTEQAPQQGAGGLIEGLEKGR